MIKTISKDLILLGIFLILSLTLTCKRSVSPGYTDVDAIKDYIYAHPSIFSADVFDTNSTDPDFYRQITKRDNWIEINFYEPNDTIFFRYAIVNWNDSIQGVFHTFISGNEYTKDFKAFSRVQARFEQWGNSGDIYRGWLLMRISNIQIYSLNNPTVGFGSVKVNTSGVDSSISLGGPLYELKNVLKFKNLSLVKLSIQVTDSTDFYYLHINEGNGWMKTPFTNKGNKLFTTQWTTNTQDFNSYKHAYIDCLDSATVSDSTTRYNSRTWGILYKINP